MNTLAAAFAPALIPNSMNHIRCCWSSSSDLARQVPTQFKQQLRLSQSSAVSGSTSSRSSHSSSHSSSSRSRSRSRSMSKHGAVLLGQVRFFMCRAGVQSVRHIELSGLRVTPATAQRFATLQLRQQKHRSFASSASSADGGDGGKKQDKHIKETSPTSESNDKESSNDKTDKLKVGWEKCDDGNCDPSRFSKFPGYRVARKVRMFRQKQKHKKMVEAYQAYRDKINRENEILVKTQQRIIKAEKEAKERQEHEQHLKNNFNLWETIKTWAVFGKKNDGNEKPN